MIKKVGPGWAIPATSLLFGICSFGTAFVDNFAQLCGVRFMLGRSRTFPRSLDKVLILTNGKRHF